MCSEINWVSCVDCPLHYTCQNKKGKWAFACCPTLSFFPLQLCRADYCRTCPRLKQYFEFVTTKWWCPDCVHVTTEKERHLPGFFDWGKCERCGKDDRLLQIVVLEPTEKEIKHIERKEFIK